MGLLSSAEKLVDWLLDAKARRSAQIGAYLAEVQTACQGLATVQDPNSDEAVFLHEQIKHAYELASSKLPPSIIQGHGGDLYRALSSARIYYWLRVVETKGEEELQALLADRRRMSSSFEVLANLLWEASPKEGRAVPLDRLDLDQIRRTCLRDIQALSQIRQLHG